MRRGFWGIQTQTCWSMRSWTHCLARRRWETSACLEEHYFLIENVDSTIIAQAPKMKPHIEQMRRNIAEALQVDISQVSVKATTEERLGFTGRGEGISAQAVALITSPMDLEARTAFSSGGGCAACPMHNRS